MAILRITNSACLVPCTMEYGYLYNWYAATDVREISSSSGWRVPSKTDWESMLNEIAIRSSNTWNDANLKTGLPDLTYWNDITNFTNETGIGFVGGGYRLETGIFYELKAVAYYHSSTSLSTDNFYNFIVESSPGADIGYNGGFKKYGDYIRLVSDATGVADGTTTAYIGNDGKIYPAIAINGLYWTTANLAETLYRNLDPIPTVENNATWAGLTTGAKCAYDNDYSLVGCGETAPVTTTTTELITTTTTAAPATTTTTTAEVFSGTSYFVSSDGTGDGLTSSTPTQISTINGTTLLPGDAVLFKRGDSFDGTLTITDSGTVTDNITISAYGTGDKPKLYGSREVTGWSLYSGNIYRKAYATEPSQVFVDGVKMRLARYQSSGYSFITSSPSVKSDRFTSTQIDGSINHIGSICYLRAGYYQSPVYEIIAQTGQELVLPETPGESNPTHVGNGFVLMGKLEYLTVAGEWVYKDGYIYLWAPNNASPTSVRVSIDDYGINCANTQHLVIKDLEIAHQKLSGIYARGSSYHTIQNNDFLYNEEIGYKNDGKGTGLDYNTNTDIKDNYFRGQNGLGIYMYHSINVLVEGNEFREIGVFNEIGKLGHGEKDTWGSGFEISQPNNPYVDPSLVNFTFQYNDFYDMCYNGFFWRGKATVQRNFFDGICINRQDGAAVYTNTQGNDSLIKENIVIDAIGQKYGYWTSRAFAVGIYADEFCEKATVEYNTCVNAGEAGIKMHNNRTSIVRFNNIADARTGIDILGRTDGVGTEEIDINNNTFIQNIKEDRDSYLVNNLFMWAHNSPAVGSGSPQFTSNSNTFVYPHTSIDMFNEGGYLTLAEWQALGYDALSTLEQTALGAGETYQCSYNKSKTTKTYSVTGDNVKDVDQVAVSGFTLQPYRSIILRGSNIQVTET